MTFGKRLRSMRKMRFLTGAELADAVGVSQATIYAYEQDRTEPQISTAIALCRVFGCSIEELLFGEAKT